ncbi:ribosome small subunit-dependent GTPase A [Halobacillus litoralis]|uniref:ribosome small subunit-dependent GTPase A n=1 Tax=Halobacillus litoralis TaxID=45668 RepID=UPI001CD51FBD|nr:ribosome small subunit-dependent GTPase A [Halobacillus litoralis]MCA0969499.1 ribosome small subunit-dependent GTPase A [Halobacillus litoralis]
MITDDFFKNQCEENDKVGRIALSSHGIYSILIDQGTVEGRLPGRFHHHTIEVKDFPAVGDWVVYQKEVQGKVLIDRVLRRKTLLSRKKAGTTTDEQVMVANADVVLIVTALTKEWNVRRIERYVHQVYESGAMPVIVCTKKDLCDTVSRCLYEIERVAPGVPVHAINTLTGEGVEGLAEEFRPGETITLIGSSGVGKSTLINRLLSAETQKTNAVRSRDDRGRHTTTHRELFELPSGTMIIDTPGMRELQLWGDESTIGETFQDIDQLSEGCKFRDCQHESEPGCNVLAAIHEGELDEQRLESYRKLKRELRRLELKDKYGTHRTNRMLHGPNKING